MKILQRKVLKFLIDRGWDKLRPSDLAKSISIESSELLELFQWNNQPLDEVVKDDKKVTEVKKELADVMIYCFQMSALLKIDMEQAVLDKLKYAQGKYPAHLMKNRKAAEPGTEDLYLKIKQEYRRSGKS